MIHYVFFWDRIVPGGVIVFDEYAYHTWSESNGVDRFLKGKNLNLLNTHIATPTAYIIKPLENSVQDFILALSNINKYIDIEHVLYSIINTNNINILDKLNCEGFYFHGLKYSH